MDAVEDLYKEELLEHYRHPQNYGRLKDVVRYRDFNPVCGDEIEVYVKIKSGKVEDIKFTGKGCAISQAAASIITEHVKGKKTEEVKKIKKERVLELLPIKISSLRIKCALLAIKAIQKVIVNNEAGKLK